MPFGRQHEALSPPTMSPTKRSDLPKFRRSKRITENENKGAYWKQTGSCFDRTTQPASAGQRPGTHFLSPGGFRQTLKTATMQQTGLSLTSKAERGEAKDDFAFTIRRNLPRSEELGAAKTFPSIKMPRTLRGMSSPSQDIFAARPRTTPVGI